MIRTALVSLVFGLLGSLLGIALALRLGFLPDQRLARVDLQTLIREQTRTMVHQGRTGDADAAAAAARVETALRAVAARHGHPAVLIAPALALPGRIPDLTGEIREALQ